AEPPPPSALPPAGVVATMTPIAPPDEPAPGDQGSRRSAQRAIGVAIGLAGASGLVAGTALWAAAVGRYDAGSADNHCRTVGAFAGAAACNAIAGLNEAYPLACANGQVDADNDETDIDCGGRVCPVRCSAHQACHIDADCGEGLICIMAVCFPDHCGNGTAD